MEKLEYELAKAVADTVATFARHNYWKDKLYQKIKGRESLDEAEILVAAVNSKAYQLGIYVCPVGSNWCVPCSKESAEKYIKEYDDIWKDYINWQWNQR